MKVKVECIYDTNSDDKLGAFHEITEKLGSRASDLIVTPLYTNEDIGWCSDDMTFCSSECDRVKCYRHPSNIRYHNIPHSFADLKGTNICDLER